MTVSVGGREVKKYDQWDVTGLLCLRLAVLIVVLWTITGAKLPKGLNG